MTKQKHDKRVKYDSKVYDKLVFALAMNSTSKFEIYNKLNINARTFDNWLKKYPSFRKAFEDGKLAEAVATKGLSDSTQDKEYTEVKKHYVYNDQGEKVLASITENTKIRPASVEAQKFLLKNRNPQKWDNQVEVGGGEGVISQLVAFIDSFDMAGYNVHMDMAYENHIKLCKKYDVPPLDRREFFLGKADLKGCVIDGHKVDDNGYYIDENDNLINALTGELVQK